MRYFWLEFQKLYEQFDDLSIRWISRNGGDALNQIADRLAMEGSEIYQVNEKGDYTVEEFLSNTFPYDCILVDGGRYYSDYETVRDSLLDSMVTLDSPAIVTINKPGAQGFAEYFAQEYNLPLIRVIAPECVNSNAMDYLKELNKSSSIKKTLSVRLKMSCIKRKQIVEERRHDMKKNYTYIFYFIGESKEGILTYLNELSPSRRIDFSKAEIIFSPNLSFSKVEESNDLIELSVHVTVNSNLSEDDFTEELRKTLMDNDYEKHGIVWFFIIDMNDEESDEVD